MVLLLQFNQRSGSVLMGWIKLRHPAKLRRSNERIPA
jgi:hypothetical protein